jgi:hypothetical protein
MVAFIAIISGGSGAAQGAPLRYVNVDPQVWQEQMLAKGSAPHTVDHLSRLWQALRSVARANPAALEVTADVEQVTGNPPETLREFLRGPGPGDDAAAQR